MSTAARVRVAVVAATMLAGCGSSRKDSARGALGKATGAAMRAAVEAAAATVEPWRCARLDEPVTVTAPTGWALDGHRLRRVDEGSSAAGFRFAVIGDARGAGAPTVAALDGVRRALDAEPVDLVLSLGGMGISRQEIATALGPVTAGASWLTVAVPGDRESLTEHRAAVAELVAGGARVVDGSQVRLVEAGGVVIATLPGAAHRERLGAGVAGCVHADADIAALLEALRPAPAPADPGDGKGGKPPLTVLVTQQAPRGRTDLAPGGVHAGERGLAAQLAALPVDLVAHGAVDDASAPAGKIKRGVAAVVAVGAIDATLRYRDDGTPVRPTAMVFTAGARELAWKPLSPRVLP